MNIESYRTDDPTALSPLAFARRAARLPFGEIFGRLRNLFIGLPKNAVKIGLLSYRLKRRGKIPVFILLTGRMGDLVAAEPVIRHVRRPGDHVIWLCRPSYTGILRFNPFVNEIVTVGSDLEASLLRRIFFQQRWVNLLLNGTLCNVFGTRLKNPNQAGIEAGNRYGFGANADIFALLGLNKRLHDRPRVYADPEFNAAGFLADVFSKEAPFLVFHPTSDEASRSWPGAKARAFAEWVLLTTKLNVIELGLNPLLAPGPRVFTMKNTLTIPHQFSVIGKASAFVGVDSGFAHIANALGVPSILLLGEYLGHKTHLPIPVQSRDVVVRGAGKTYEIEVGDVCDAVSSVLARREYVAAK